MLTLSCRATGCANCSTMSLLSSLLLFPCGRIPLGMAQIMSIPWETPWEILLIGSQYLQRQRLPTIGLNATVPLTLYLAGLSFLGYARYKQFEPGSSLTGCFVYIFGGYSVVAFTQIYLLYPLVVAPLVVWGVDKIFEGETPIMFVFGMFLCFFCSVSLAYTTCISLGVYCLIKVFNLNDRITFKGFFSLGL